MRFLLLLLVCSGLSLVRDYFIEKLNKRWFKKMVRRFNSEQEYNRAFLQWIQRGLQNQVNSFSRIRFLIKISGIPWNSTAIHHLRSISDLCHIRCFKRKYRQILYTVKPCLYKYTLQILIWITENLELSTCKEENNSFSPRFTVTQKSLGLFEGVSGEGLATSAISTLEIDHVVYFAGDWVEI